MITLTGTIRWLVALNTGDTVDVFRVNMPGQELLQLVKEFPKVTYKDIYNERPVQVDPKGPKNLKKLKSHPNMKDANKQQRHRMILMKRGLKSIRNQLIVATLKVLVKKLIVGLKKTEDKNSESQTEQL